MRSVIESSGRTVSWRALAYGHALVLGIAVAYFLFRLPFQLTDNIGNMLTVEGATYRDLFLHQFYRSGFVRPLLWVNLKVVFDLADGYWFEVFRAYQALQIAVLMGAFLYVVRVRTALDYAAASFGLLVLLGMHTTMPLVMEAFPINNYLTIVLCCLLALCLATVRPRWWVDVAGVALLAFAALTVESGLLVWVCIVAAYLVGLPGFSRRGAVAVTVVVAAYLVMRFAVLDLPGPSLMERSTGFGFAILEPADLLSRFGEPGRPFLYAYNVVASVATVLFAEPREGVWEFTRGLMSDEELRPWMAINVAASTVTSLILGAFVLRRASKWLRRDLDDADRIVLVFLAMLAGNAVISYPYTKDEIMSPAGAFYALAATVALRAGLAGVRAPRALVAQVALALVLCSVSGLWAMRVAGLGYNMRYRAFVNRNDWVGADRRPDVASVRERRFVEHLQRQTLNARVPSPSFVSRNLSRYLDEH